MPSAGDVTVQFKAETRQFRRELKLTGEAWGKLGTEARLAQAASKKAGDNAFTRIASDVRRAKTDFRAGVISTRDYGMALRFAQQEASALVRQGTRPAGKALSTFNFIMGQTGPKTQAARQGIGTIRSTIASLGARMVGINGTVGSLIGGIGQFALGNLAAIGVIGGLAALAKGFQAIKERSAEAARTIGEDLDELLKRIGGRKLTEAQQAIQNLGDAHARMRDVIQEIGRSAAEFRRGQLAAGGGDVLAAGGTLPMFQMSDQQVENLQNATKGVEAAQRAVTRITAQERSDAFDEMREAHEKAAEAARDLDERWNSIVRSMRELRQTFSESRLGSILAGSTAGTRRLATGTFEERRPSLFGGLRRPSTLETMERLGGTGLRIPEIDAAGLQASRVQHRDRLRRQLLDLEGELRKRRTAFQEIGEQLGESMIRGLVRSFLEGGGNLGDRLKSLLKTVIADAVSEGLIAAIRNAKGGEGGSLFGSLFKTLFQVGVTAGVTAATGGNVAAGAAAGGAVANAPRGVVGPGLSGSMATSGGPLVDLSKMPKASNPLAASRDAEWLALLAESNEFLKAGGYRFAV